MKSICSLVALALIALPGCGGSDKAPAASADVKAQPAPAEAMPAQVNPADLEKKTRKVTLVPSPIEMQREVIALGISQNLSSNMLGVKIDASATNKEKVAIGTGVVIADVLLTVLQSEDAVLMGQLANVRDGLSALKGGKDIAAMVDGLIEQVKAGGADRTALLTELDELASVAIPELEFEGDAAIVPMIQAGSWLEGVHLIATASLEAGKLSVCDQMLKQPMIVEYFKEYTAQKGEDGAGSEGDVYKYLSASLANLEKIAAKTDPMTEADVREIAGLTGNLLKVL